MSRDWVRGCAGNITGRPVSRPTASSALKMFPSLSLESTFSWRCAVARMYSRGLRPRFSSAWDLDSASFRFSSTASTMVLPVTVTPRSMPSLARFFLASSVGA